MNTKAVATQNSQVEQYWNAEQIKIIKSVIAPGLTNDELAVFAHVCKQVKLDPLAKQIYAIKRGGKMTIQTAIDGFRLVAERTGKYAPGEETKFIYNSNNILIGATAYVKKLTPDGSWHSISATAYITEYTTGQGLWKKMPHVMIEKCAESRALRRAFPADLSGLYTEEEMEQAKLEQSNNEELEEAEVEIEEPAIISDDQYLDLLEALSEDQDLTANVKAYMKRKYETDDLTKMPVSLFEYTMKRTKENKNG